MAYVNLHSPRALQYNTVVSIDNVNILSLQMFPHDTLVHARHFYTRTYIYLPKLREY